jgi:hypothetical protein
MIINFLRSLTLTIIFSFAAPIFLIGGFFSIIFLFSYLPGLQNAAETITTLLLEFLSVFGSGAPLRGVVVISFTCSFVGALFDTYAYYRYQILR